MPKPDCCTDDIYHIMTDCWDSDPFIRKKPQATLRDLRQIWLQSNIVFRVNTTTSELYFK